MLKGSETHENGNSKKRWVFEYLHMHTLAIHFVVDFWLWGLSVSCSSFMVLVKHFKLGLGKGLSFISIC